MKLKSYQFNLVVAIYFAIFCNLGVFYTLFINMDFSYLKSYLFFTSIPIFFISALNILFTIFAIPKFEKIFVILNIFIAGICHYAVCFYKTLFDYTMFLNIINTDIGESASYLSFSGVIWIICFCLIPSFIVSKVTIIHHSFFRDILYKILSIFTSLIVVGIIGLFFANQYIVTARNNLEIKHMIMPTAYLSSVGKYIYENTTTTPEYEKLGLDSKQINSYQKNFVVLIVGETARSMNYELNGYGRSTNAFTKDLGVISFKDVTSCATCTIESVPCMFSFLGQKNFSRSKAKYQDNVLDVLNRAGVNVLWLENDGGCKGVCDKIDHIDMHDIVINKSELCSLGACKDEVFLEDLDAKIDSLHNKGVSNNNLLIMHIIGSHGPSYYERFFEKDAKFYPYCKRNDVQHCTQEELYNVYDNTILYTDYVMSKIIQSLKKRNDLNTALIYLSDHGESLGEKGLYLHGIPFAVAPIEQKKVPMIFWLSDNIIKSKKYDKNCLIKQATEMSFSHDNLPHILLGMNSVETSLYKSELDILNSCIVK
jgi:lipid A ethanolaminephosphotransferase